MRTQVYNWTHKNEILAQIHDSYSLYRCDFPSPPHMQAVIQLLRDPRRRAWVTEPMPSVCGPFRHQSSLVERAALHGDCQLFDFLIGQNAMTHKAGRLAILVACREGHVRVTQLLLKNIPALIHVTTGEITNKRDLLTEVVIGGCASQRRTSMIKLLYIHGIDIERIRHLVWTRSVRFDTALKPYDKHRSLEKRRIRFRLTIETLAQGLTQNSDTKTLRGNHVCRLSQLAMLAVTMKLNAYLCPSAPSIYAKSGYSEPTEYDPDSSQNIEYREHTYAILDATIKRRYERFGGFLSLGIASIPTGESRPLIYVNWLDHARRLLLRDVAVLARARTTKEDLSLYKSTLNDIIQVLGGIAESNNGKWGVDWDVVKSFLTSKETQAAAATHRRPGGFFITRTQSEIKRLLEFLKKTGFVTADSPGAPTDRDTVCHRGIQEELEALIDNLKLMLEVPSLRSSPCPKGR